MNIDCIDLENILSATGTTIVTIVAHTDPRMVKKHRATGEPNPYYGRVVKVAKINGFINWNYASAVNNQRLRETGPETIESLEAVPVFDSLPRKWGWRVLNSPFVDHDNGTRYLEIKCQRAIEVVYLFDGEQVDIEALQPYLCLRKGESRRQEVEREIVLRDYKLENIKELRIDGRHYTVSA